MYVYIIAGVICLVVLVIVLRYYQRSKKNKAIVTEADDLKAISKLADEWVKKADRITTDAELIQKITPNWELFLNLPNDHPIRPLHLRLADAKARERQRHNSEAFLRRYSGASTPFAKASMCTEMESSAWNSALGLTLETVGARIVQLMHEELAAAQAGNTGALKRFLAFHDKAMRTSYNGVKDLLSEQEVRQLDFPPGWDDLVTDLIEAPTLEMYREIDKSRPAGEIGLMAAEALRTRSLKLSKIALAYYRLPRKEYRRAIGPVMHDELTKAVNDMHRAEGKFSTQL